MSKSALNRYRGLVKKLWVARTLALGGELSQDEEAAYAEELNDCRRELTKQEEEQLAEELRGTNAFKPHGLGGPKQLASGRNT